MDEQEQPKPRRGRPPGKKNGVTEAIARVLDEEELAVEQVTAEEALLIIDDEATSAIRARAVKLGLMSDTVAATMPLAEIQAMIVENEEAGIGLSVEEMQLKLKAPPLLAGANILIEAAGIIKELLEIISIRNGNAMLLTSACSRCQDLAEHVKRDCVCHRARAFLGGCKSEGVL